LRRSIHSLLIGPVNWTIRSCLDALSPDRWLSRMPASASAVSKSIRLLVSMTPRVNLIRFGFVARSLVTRVSRAFRAPVMPRGGAQHRIVATAIPANRNLMRCVLGRFINPSGGCYGEATQVRSRTGCDYSRRFTLLPALRCVLS